MAIFVVKSAGLMWGAYTSCFIFAEVPLVPPDEPSHPAKSIIAAPMIVSNAARWSMMLRTACRSGSVFRAHFAFPLHLI